MLKKILKIKLTAVLICCLISILISCSSDDEGVYIPDGSSVISISKDTLTAEVDTRFLSVAVDSCRAFGQEWLDFVPRFDFTRPKLRNLAQHLTPGFLRIGGSDADVTLYDMSDSPVETLPDPYERLLSKEIWDNINDFAIELGFDVMFTVNAGPGPRDENDDWIDTNARELLEYTVESDYPVDVWEFGNEVDGFIFYHDSWYITADQYVEDLAKMDALIEDVDPGTFLAGPSSYWFPVSGEIMPIYEDILLAGGDKYLDVITWHYYPQGSADCEIHSRYATPYLLMDPANLDEIEIWADEVETIAANNSPDSQIWLGETGNAQCGGQAGISDVFVAGFWWMDQLGLLAKRGQQIVVRQTLAGDDYGIIDPETLDPRPDYWNSVIWNMLMGNIVLSADKQFDNENIRTYAQCTPSTVPGYVSGSVTILVINLDMVNQADIGFNNVGSSFDIYTISSSDLLSQEYLLNGEALTADEDGNIPEITGKELNQAYLTLEPATYSFIVAKDANAAACR